jgi:threonyl-tRNA synthetase
LGIRAASDLSAQRMNAKIREAQLMKVPYMLVVGENEAKNNQVSLRVRDGSRADNIPLSDFIARIQEKIGSRSEAL